MRCRCCGRRRPVVPVRGPHGIAGARLDKTSWLAGKRDAQSVWQDAWYLRSDGRRRLCCRWNERRRHAGSPDRQRDRLPVWYSLKGERLGKKLVGMQARALALREMSGDGSRSCAGGRVPTTAGAGSSDTAAGRGWQDETNWPVTRLLNLRRGCAAIGACDTHGDPLAYDAMNESERTTTPPAARRAGCGARAGDHHPGLIFYTAARSMAWGRGPAGAGVLAGSWRSSGPARLLKVRARHHRHLLLHAGGLAQLPTRGPVPAVLHDADLLRRPEKQLRGAGGQVCALVVRAQGPRGHPAVFRGRDGPTRSSRGCYRWACGRCSSWHCGGCSTA